VIPADPIEIQELKKSAKFFKNQEPKKHPNYFVHNILNIGIDGLWLEFGVWIGSSAKIIAHLMPKQIRAAKLGRNRILYGFDSFEGLPEDWEDPETGEVQSEGTKGYFNLNGRVPEPPFPNIKFIKGWFNETLPEFIKEHKDPIAFLHIDCDLYSSTKTIFDNLHSQIVPGTVIMFDEIHNYSGYQAHEFKAFKEFVDEFDVSYEWIGHVSDGRQASLKITGKGK